MTLKDPLVLAALEVLDLALEEMRGCIEGASPDALNWRPGSKDTNSITVLTVHALGSTRSWLSVAFGAPLPARDRETEFGARADDAASLLDYVRKTGADCRSLLTAAAPADWSTMRRTHPRPRADAPSDVTAAWALLHALEHLREHEGQLFLTRQLWDQREVDA